MQKLGGKIEIKVKEEKGITLVALTVMVIVLLILAGITIGSLGGNEGVLSKVFKSKQDAEKAGAMEMIKKAVIASHMIGRGKIDEIVLNQELEDSFGEKGTGYRINGNNEDGWTITVPKYEISYYLDSEGNVEQIEYEEEFDNSESLVLALVDDLGTRSTIYLYNNTEKITSGTITITNPDSTTKNITAIEDTSEIANTANYTTYTVSKNGTYIFSATANGETTETKIRVKNIEKFTKVDDLGLSYVNGDNKAYSYKGAAVPKGYYVDTKSKVETGLVITDEIDDEGYSTGNEWVWVPVNSTVGNNDFYLTGSGTMVGTTVPYTKYSKLWNFTTNSSTGVNTRTNLANPQAQPSGTSGDREPAILTDETNGEVTYYSSINNRTTEAAFESVEDVSTQYVTDFENMCDSVDTYKGFYIGRYEITTNGEKPGTSLTNKNWYYFYNQCLTYGKDYTESGMIYGCLWDATMQWLAKSEYWIGNSEQTYSGYGNYKTEAVTVNNDSVEITIKAQDIGKILLTGQISYTKSNNIYDISGNSIEWTQEALSYHSRIYRGRSL